MDRGQDELAREILLGTARYLRHEARDLRARSSFTRWWSENERRHSEYVETCVRAAALRAEARRLRG